jgi:exodeoxyribonuclease V alpha subunit
MHIDFQERPVDRQVAAFLCRGAEQKGGELLRLAVSLLSQSVGRGNICLDLASLGDTTLKVSVDREITVPSFDSLCTLLHGLPSLGRPGEVKPLVLDRAGRLYLYRYWHYEQELARVIRSKNSELVHIDETRLNEGLKRIFPEGESSQQLAASAALHSLFSVIAGGPGTGKTSTVVRVLALILEQPGGMQHRIAMAAPTGKAAARLISSVRAIRDTLCCDDAIKSAIPTEALTIHRLLGTRQGSMRFRYSSANPLPFDTVIVDEASMVDLPLMAALVTAIKPGARLILLGDSDQLASVEAGAVLGDICSAGLTSGSPLGGAVVFLEKNYRFQSGSGLDDLSRAVNNGRGTQALELMKSGKQDGSAWRDVRAEANIYKLLEVRVNSAYRQMFEATSPSEALLAFNRFRILCALRDGPSLTGVHSVNRAVESILAREGLMATHERFYRCRPILVTANDYSMRLFNGDTGIVFPDPLYQGALRAFFPDSDGAVRSIAPERLPEHETAFAMTVHKSQGSEFDRVLLLLPSVDSELMTRELIYTAITRAKESVEIWGDESLFCAAVKRKSERNSGLRDALLQCM